MATPNIVPRADSEGGLGTASKYWASAYIDLIDAGNINCSTSSTFVIQHTTANQDIRFKGIDGSSSITALLLDMSAAGAATFSGNLTLTTGDFFLASGAVINFDGGNVTLTHSSGKLTLADSDALTFGTQNDLQIFHGGTNSNIDNYTGDLIISNTSNGNDVILKCDDGSGGLATYLTLDGGDVKTNVFKTMEFQDNVKLAIGDSEDLIIDHNATDSRITNYTGNLEIINSTDDGDIIFQSDDGSGGVTAYLTLDGGAVETQFNKDVRVIDNEKLIIGTGNDLEVFSLGQDILFRFWSGNATFTNYSDDADIIFQNDDGAGGVATYFYLDGSSAAHNGSATTALYTNWPDNSRISLGTSHDLTIHHSGTSSAFANAVGHLEFIQSATDADIKFYCDDGSGGITEYFRLDGSDVKIISSQAFHLLDNKSLIAGTGSDFTINHDGTNSYLSNNTGDLYIRNLADDKDIIFQSDDGSGGVETYFFLDGSASSGNPFTVFPDLSELAFGTSRDLRIKHDGTDSKITNSTGDLYIINNADDGDIIFQSDDGSGGVATYLTLDGSSATNIFSKDVLLTDNISLKIGSAADLKIYHDGSNSYISDTDTGSLKILTSQLAVSNAAGTEALLNATQDGAVNLYYNGVGPKLATASDGVTVTGDVSITSTAASAVGGGFDGAETATIQIGEVNQEIITTIQIDLGTGGATDIVSSSTAGDVIGENDTAAAFITKYDSTKNGVLYKAELICLETPAGGDTDINLVLNATSLAEDAAGETEGHVIVDGGAQTIGMRTESTASVVTAAAGAHNDYIYLTHGGTTAGTYSAGKFLIRLYGALATL